MILNQRNVDPMLSQSLWSRDLGCLILELEEIGLGWVERLEAAVNALDANLFDFQSLALAHVCWVLTHSHIESFCEEFEHDGAADSGVGVAGDFDEDAFRGCAEFREFGVGHWWKTQSGFARFGLQERELFDVLKDVKIFVQASEIRSLLFLSDIFGFGFQGVVILVSCDRDVAAQWLDHDVVFVLGRVANRLGWYFRQVMSSNRCELAFLAITVVELCLVLQKFFHRGLREINIVDDAAENEASHSFD